MRKQGGIWFPGFPIVGADPKAGWIDPGIDGSGLVGTTRLDHPYIVQFQCPVLGELDTMLWLLPGLSEIVAITQERAKEIAILGGKQAMTAPLIEDGVKHAASFQGTCFNGPI